MQCFFPGQMQHGFFFEKPWFADTYRTVAIRHHVLPNNFSLLGEIRMQGHIDEINSIIDQAMATLNPEEIYVILVTLRDIKVRLHAIRFPADAPVFRQAAVMQLCYVEDYFRMNAEEVAVEIE